MREQVSEGLGILGWTIFGCITLCIAWLILAGFGLTVEPWRLNRENAIIHASNSYVTTQRTALVTLASQYRAVEAREVTAGDPESKTALEGQARGILNQMRNIASLIPNDVPSDAAALIAESR